MVGQSPGGNGVDSLPFPTGFNELFEEKVFLLLLHVKLHLFRPANNSTPCVAKVRKGKCLTKLTGVHLHLSTFPFINKFSDTAMKTCQNYSFLNLHDCLIAACDRNRVIGKGSTAVVNRRGLELFPQDYCRGNHDNGKNLLSGI